MSTTSTYQLYRDVLGIANSIVIKSKGLGQGFGDFHAETIIADVRRADEVAQVAQRYWEAMNRAHKATERLRAAKLLDIDLAPYLSEATEADGMKSMLIDLMLDIREQWRKGYDGSWIPKEKNE